MTVYSRIRGLVDRFFQTGTEVPQVGQPAEIDGETIPVHQIDWIDDRAIVSVHVETAVRSGYDFSDVWLHKEVNVEIEGSEFTAEIDMCQVEHGFAAIGLAKCGGNV